MGPSNNLDVLQIASPCQASWADMRGDDRTRFCESCSKHVYNLSGMTRAQALSLVEATEGRLCVRFYRREDGSILTADCPVGLSSAVRRRLMRLATAGVLAFAVARSSLWMYSNSDRILRVPDIPPGPGLLMADWLAWAKNVLGISSPGVGSGQVLMGAVRCTIPSPAQGGPSTSPPSSPPTVAGEAIDVEPS